MNRRLYATLGFLIFNAATHAQQDSARLLPARFNLHFQTTYIYQYSARFHSPYEGQNSLSGDEERQSSLTLTLYGGARLWKGGEFYVNPEIAGGSGLSGALGMAGSSNGETFRVGDPAPTLYLGRAFFVQTFGLGAPEVDTIEDGANTLPAYAPKNHLRLLIGKYSLGDLFDQNEVSNSPRTQFMNWALMSTGAWDYAANVRGYTLAASAELALNDFTYKISASTLPTVANGDNLETDLSKGIALNAEIDRAFKLRGRDANLRLLGYYNRTHMGSYDEANHRFHLPFVTAPDVVATRAYSRSKAGVVLNADVELSNALSAFTRVGWNDGHSETWCFTEIDQTLALGAALKGTGWKRKEDVTGLALVANGLSQDHRRYLTLGGNGFILGDGALNYAPEGIAEIYYSAKLRREGLWITGDYQFCLNPGCNADRGPANIVSIRVHVEL